MTATKLDHLTNKQLVKAYDKVVANMAIATETKDEKMIGHYKVVLAQLEYLVKWRLHCLSK